MLRLCGGLERNMPFERIDRGEGSEQNLKTGKSSNLDEVLDALSSRPVLLATAVADAAIGTALTLKGSPKMGSALIFMSGVNTANFIMKSFDDGKQKSGDFLLNKFDFLDGAKLNKLQAARDKQPDSRGFLFLFSDTVEELSKQPFAKSRFENIVTNLQRTDKKGAGWDISIRNGFPVLTDTDEGQAYTMTKPGKGMPIYP